MNITALKTCIKAIKYQSMKDKELKLSADIYSRVLML